MLLAAILLDTANLSPVAQKATDADRAMVSWLFPQVQWTRDAHDITDMEFIQAPDLQAHSMAEMHKKLDKLKGQVSHLSARDLLRKDYKQWVIQSHEEGGRRWRVGISSVGYRLVKWIKRDGEDRVSAAVRDWMAEQELDLLLVMTHGKARVGKKKDGGDKVYGRDLIVVIKQAADVPVVRGLEASKDLDLSPYEYIQTDAPNTVWFYTQGKAEASRKQVFPAVKHLIESM
ncbi:Exopolyphosphatase [Coemansia sp. Benny D115]|nr:Exopolyphosphatase [Coemansia sp. Benny D115]